MRKRQQCRSCRASFEQVRGPSGKFIPAQRVTKLYQVRMDMAGDPELVEVPLDQGEEYMVSHFQTCPDAAEYTRR